MHALLSYNCVLTVVKYTDMLHCLIATSFHKHADRPTVRWEDGETATTIKYASQQVYHVRHSIISVKQSIGQTISENVFTKCHKSRTKHMAMYAICRSVRLLFFE